MSDITTRIMTIAKDNTMSAVILSGISADKIRAALEKIEQMQITRVMINCFWSHVCNRDRNKFDEFITGLAARPVGCVHGCIYEPIKVDESKIFGPAEKESFRDCAMAECETPSLYYCSSCYCVRYCSPLCQRLDYPRHKKECKNIVAAITMLKSYGETYAKRAIKNNISISDASWDRLWKKYGRAAVSPSDASAISHRKAIDHSDLPREIWNIILGYEAPTELLSWIPIEKIDWVWLSGNSHPEAIELLKKNPEKIDWAWLSGNSHPEAIELLKKNPEKIDWVQLSGNSHPEAIELLKKNPEKINWLWLSGNSGIFQPRVRTEILKLVSM
jgi:hypothetical protein